MDFVFRRWASAGCDFSVIRKPTTSETLILSKIRSEQHTPPASVQLQASLLIIQMGQTTVTLQQSLSGKQSAVSEGH